MSVPVKRAERITEGTLAIRHPGTALDRDALQKAIFNSSTFSKEDAATRDIANELAPA